MTMQAWGAGLALLVAGYAWHDGLRGRFPLAARAALAGALLAGLVLALLNLPMEPLAFAFGAAPALGWALRLPRAGDARAPPALDVALGLAYAGGVLALALAWSGALVTWGFIVGAALVAARVALLDPLLTLFARRRGRPQAEEDTVAPPTTVK